MGKGATVEGRPVWIFLIVGAVLGLGVGILVAATTDIPFAPEIGVLVGLAAGWCVRLLKG